jgi:hypothetical protein
MEDQDDCVPQDEQQIRDRIDDELVNRDLLERLDAGSRPLRGQTPEPPGNFWRLALSQWNLRSIEHEPDRHGPKNAEWNRNHSSYHCLPHGVAHSATMKALWKDTGHRCHRLTPQHELIPIWQHWSCLATWGGKEAENTPSKQLLKQLMVSEIFIAPPVRSLMLDQPRAGYNGFSLDSSSARDKLRFPAAAHHHVG